jgi:integrase
MATIRKKGDLQWHVQVRKKGYAPVTKTFETRAQAERWATVIESEMARGVFVDRSEAEATTLSDALDRYQAEVSVLKKTASKERSIIKSWKSFALAGRSLASIKQADVAKWRDARLKVVGAATVRNEMALLSHLFTVAGKDWGMGISNPVLMVRKPAPVKPRDRRLSKDEIEKIIQATESQELPVVIRLLTETAMRRGELSKLRWDNIDMKNRVAHLLDTKNGEDRHVPLSSAAAEALKSLPRRIDGKVIGMTGDAITRAFARACRRAGVGDARVHDLRHEAVSRLFEKGLGVMEVASVSGHKTLSQLKRYTHMSAAELARKLG